MAARPGCGLSLQMAPIRQAGYWPTFLPRGTGR